MKPLWSPWVTLSAPDTPMTKTLASTQSGLTASVTAEAHVETIATTLLTSISLRAARTPASAVGWSSSWKSWMGRALIPPALLIRSTTATTERCMSGAYEPPAPVSGHKVPIGMGSFDCAERIAGAPSTSPAVPEALKSSRRVIVIMSGSPMSAAEIETSDLRVIAKRLARPFGANPTHGENIRSLAQREGLARVLLHEEKAEPSRIDLANAIEHQALERRREPRRRLVEEEQPRLDHQSHRHREHLSLAARQRAGPGPPALGEDREELHDGPGPLVQCSGSRPAADREVLPHAERREHVRLLGHVAEPARDDALDAGARDVGAAKRDSTGARTQKPGQRLQQGRFPGAIGSDDGHQLSVVDAKREAMEDVVVAVACGEIVHLEKSGHRAVTR